MIMSANKRYTIKCPFFFTTSAKTQKDAIKQLEKIILKMNGDKTVIDNSTIIDVATDKIKIERLGF